MENFYVYKHIRLKDGSTFYIGKGSGDRLHCAKNRNVHWNNIVKKDAGFKAEIIKESLSEQEAFALEISLIKEIGIDNLTNMTDGGEGSNTRQYYTKEQYAEWLHKKSIAQTGKPGWWRDTARPEHSDAIKSKHLAGSYTYDWLRKNKSDAHKAAISAANKKPKPRIKCDVCGRILPTTHLTKHKRGPYCKPQ